MASPCEYIVGDKRYTEAEFKDFLLNGGLDSLVKPEGAKVVSMEPPTKPPSEVPLPEGADPDLIKMANEVNDAFVEGKFGLDALDQIVGKLQDTNLENIIAQVKARLKINPDLAKQTRDRINIKKEGSEFDQAVLMYDLADLKGREAIFKVHLKTIIKSDDVKPFILAEMTPGFAGADIANVCNEAALIAARRNKAAVDLDDFNYALDRVIGGLEKKNKLISPEEKKIIASIPVKVFFKNLFMFLFVLFLFLYFNLRRVEDKLNFKMSNII
jgi:hypothetical protein